MCRSELIVKTCTSCGQSKPVDDFYRQKSGTMGSCKECTKSTVRAHRAANRAQFAEYERTRNKDPRRRVQRAIYQMRKDPISRAARVAVGNAIRDGRLIRQPCEVCGTTDNVQAHHDDYSKPLDVRWLCFKHHREHHGQTVLAAE